jgi:hypothetical protein
MARRYVPASVEKTEGAEWRVAGNPKTREALALAPDEANPQGYFTLPGFRRVCRSVAERAAKRVEAAARVSVA